MDTVRVGFGRESIVPDFPVELSGFGYRRGMASGIYDEIHVTAVVFDNGRVCLALVVAELLAIDPTRVGEIKTRLLRAAGIPPAAVLICCTHTHSAPGSIYLGGGGRVDPRYLALIEERIVRAVLQAVDSLAPCRAFYGEVAQRELGVNRRLKTNGRMELGLNENGLRDDLVRVLSFRSPAGGPVAGLSNFGCHPYLITARPEHAYLISGDFPHWAVAEVEASLGGTFLHLNGAGADICPRPIRESPHPAQEGGRRYAQQIRAAVEISRPVSLSPLGGILGAASVPLRAIPSRRHWAETLAKNKKELATLPYEAQNWSIVFSKIGQAERAIQWLDSGQTNAIDSMVQIIRLGDLCIVGLEHEVCIEVGQAVAQGVRSAIPKEGPAPIHILVASQANGCLSYLPSDTILEEGGYEADDACQWYGQPAPYAPGACHAIVTKARALMTRLLGGFDDDVEDDVGGIVDAGA